MTRVGDKFLTPGMRTPYAVTEISGDRIRISPADSEPRGYHYCDTNEAQLAAGGWIFISQYDLILRYNYTIKGSYE